MVLVIRMLNSCMPLKWSHIFIILFAVIISVILLLIASVCYDYLSWISFWKWTNLLWRGQSHFNIFWKARSIVNFKMWWVRSTFFLFPRTLDYRIELICCSCFLIRICLPFHYSGFVWWLPKSCRNSGKTIQKLSYVGIW